MKTKKWSLRWKIFQYLCFFAGTLLVILWLIQTVFLNDFYRAIKINQIKSMATEIETVLHTIEAPARISEFAKRYDGCIVIADSNGYQVISIEGYPDCPISYMRKNELKSFIVQALANGGSYLKEYDAHTMVRRHMWFLPGIEEDVSQNILYTKVITVDNTAYGIFLNTNVIPLDATIETIRYQLIFITIGMILFALLLAYVIARHLTKPIASITASSRELAKGNYDVSFDGTGYGEITELAATLEYASHELGKVDQMQKELIANVSHDLRTPLTMIAGYSELMRDMPEEMTQENIQTIIDEAHRLTSLVNDVLDLSKLIDGNHVMNKLSFNVTSLLQDITQRYKTMLGHKGFHIDFEYQEEIQIVADESKLTQVIYNLMNNAITYTGPDQYVKVTQWVSDYHIKISFTDTGEGIPEDELASIWSRYYQAKKTHRRASVGSGLGLSIVREIIAMHDGQCGVSSKVGEGSTFWFTLPL